MSVSDILIPAKVVSQHLAELARMAAQEGVDEELLDGAAGAALLYSMLFEKWPQLLGELGAETRLYNQYFWFARFVALRSAQSGPDAGLDQQQHQILENAVIEIDFEVIEQLEAEAQAGANAAIERRRELPEPLYSQLIGRTEAGQQLFDDGRFAEALPVFEAAWELLPEPKDEWNAAIWVLAAIGDCHFLMQDLHAARRVLLEAVAMPGGVGNPFLHLRLGEIALEFGEEARAADELMRAYAMGGREAFDGEDPKYLKFLASKARLQDS